MIYNREEGIIRTHTRIKDDITRDVFMEQAQKMLADIHDFSRKKRIKRKVIGILIFEGIDRYCDDKKIVMECTFR